ncbi:MAG TPA: dTDP-4-amino-4,6-dideoxygalactose transaminase [Bdellovibrionota bacterium]|nr:dTDP-4-amino-4,6-dideoxygalactose transaminase [Bdellovibrionota bacterium]
MELPLNKPFLTGDELDLLMRVCQSQKLAGDGQFTRLCQKKLEDSIACRRALLTHSCTGALEMAALLAEVKPGDEVILPSFTFVSTANAFVLRGAVPVFVDIRPDTLNLDERRIEEAVTPRTRVVVPVHYAGVACEMDEIMAIASARKLLVVEDAAQAISATYKGRALGSIGHLGALSFHETKNVVSGEGGALLINEDRFVDRAHVLWQKGTNRQKFLKGEVDKYTWVDVGSSFLPSELTAAFLWAQLQQAETINRIRLERWKAYYAAFEDLERQGLVRRPAVLADRAHNAHMFYLLVDPSRRDGMLKALQSLGIGAHFHYVPLHSSEAGRKYGRASGQLAVTDRIASSLVRLPLWVGLSQADTDRVVAEVRSVVIGKGASRRAAGA